MATFASCSSAWPLFVTIFIVFVFETQKVAALSVNLYHRDSYGSPFYDPSLSKDDIIRRALSRSLNRSHTITLNSPLAKLINQEHVYFMKIRLGTPPIDVFAAMDTGSDMTWIQCEPCIRRLPQETPLFNPRTSSTYNEIRCAPNYPCPPESKSECKEDGFCHHDIRDIDGVYSKGILSKETMRMESDAGHNAVEIPHYTFGCGTENGAARSTVVSAVIGLGTGRHSLVTQLGPHSMGTFSYCLIPHDDMSKKVSHIRFGASANVKFRETVTLPFVNKHPHNSYYLTLEAITVGRTRIEFTSLSGKVEKGNIVIDSSSVLMILPWHIYSRVRNAVIEQTNARAVSDHFRVIDLCFMKDETLQVPKIVANFRGGDVRLKRHNAYVTLGKLECLAFKGDGTSSAYGNVAQQDFIVGFDKFRGTVSFTEFDCERF